MAGRRQAIRPFSDTKAVRAAYGQARYDRLVELKRRMDPTNLFRLNQNIRP